ncbi:hypothetical protein ACGRH2_13070 [Vibrio barjaei]|uniref:Uncharacterized protein n=1 Tax=Vibrio barjaei TaxID=1676683 RepID=A0ABW7IIL4_9VIBR
MIALRVAGWLTALASVTHILIIFGGASWYRFFGAGEQMAHMSELGHWYPALLTGTIALLLAVLSAYAFSGIKVVSPLPFTNLILVLISCVFLARGVLFIPAVLVLDSSYLQELAANMDFLVVTSIICSAIGICFGVGAYARISRTH